MSGLTLGSDIIIDCARHIAAAPAARPSFATVRLRVTVHGFAAISDSSGCNGWSSNAGHRFRPPVPAPAWPRLRRSGEMLPVVGRTICPLCLTGVTLTFHRAANSSAALRTPDQSAHSREDRTWIDVVTEAHTHRAKAMLRRAHARKAWTSYACKLPLSCARGAVSYFVHWVRSRVGGGAQPA